MRAYIFAVVSVLCAFASADAQVDAFGKTWTTGNATMRVINDATGQVLAIRNGMAVASPTNLKNGTISFEMRGGHDHLAGVSFRVKDGANYEIVYFSADSSVWRDAQYQPVFQGETTWQLYPDSLHFALDMSNAPRVDAWTRVRIEVNGQRARLWLNDSAQPVLEVPDLKRDVANGAVGLWSVVPNDSGPKSELLVRNFNITNATSSAKTPAPAVRSVHAIRDWWISQRFAAFDTLGASDTLPHVREVLWKAAKVEPSGLVNLTQQLGNPAGPQTHNVFGGAGWGMAFAQTHVSVRKAETRTLLLGYSDVASVFLDGKVIYKGNNAWGAPGHPMSGRSGRGRVQFDLASIPVSLTPGTHILTLMIGDRAFGWGFKAQWADGNWRAALR